MRIKYVGDRNGHGPEETETQGIRFKKGQAVQVTGAAAKKLAQNSHFREVRRAKQVGSDTPDA